MTIYQSLQVYKSDFLLMVNDELKPPIIIGEKVKHNGIKKSKTKILVVEDDLICQKVAKIMLEQMGYLVTIVDNGTKALNVYQNYDLICCGPLSKSTWTAFIRTNWTRLSDSQNSVWTGLIDAEK